MEAKSSRYAPEFFAGCLLGGAVGDALGAPVEFMSLSEIRRRFGPQGIRHYSPAYGRLGAITDDTQMALFTAEGLIQAYDRGRERGIWHPPSMVYQAYLRWLETQLGPSALSTSGPHAGGLLSIPELHARRSPGGTCLSALQSARAGTVNEPINDSKGCGGVMRVAPVGLAGYDPFRLGTEVAAITHGHPSGYLAAGVLSAVIAEIIAGRDLRGAILLAREELQRHAGHEECLAAVDKALQLAEQCLAAPETVEMLGAGWVAEEALAISLFCALVAEGFESGVVLAVNHSGDSDSTGAIAGGILGAMLGKGSIPSHRLDQLELREVIEQMAMDLFQRFGERPVAYDGTPDQDVPPG